MTESHPGDFLVLILASSSLTSCSVIGWHSKSISNCSFLMAHQQPLVNNLKPTKWVANLHSKLWHWARRLWLELFANTCLHTFFFGDAVVCFEKAIRLSIYCIIFRIYGRDQGPGRVRFSREVDALFDSRISCTWHVISPWFRHLCLVSDGFTLFPSGCWCFWGGCRWLLNFLRWL